MHIILYPHGRHDEAHFHGHLPPKRFNLIRQPLSILAFIYQGKKAVSQFQAEEIDLENLRNRFLGDRCSLSLLRFNSLFFRLAGGLVFAKP